MSRLLVFNFKDFSPNGLSPTESEEEKGNTDNSLNVNVHFITLYSTFLCHQSGFTHDMGKRVRNQLSCCWRFMKSDIAGQMTSRAGRGWGRL